MTPARLGTRPATSVGMTDTDRDHRALIERAYDAFNARDIDGALTTMREDVEWPNGMEGGVVIGHSGVRGYWTRQWDRVDPRVTPVSFATRPDGRIDVRVHQVVCSLLGELLLDHHVRHVYTFEEGLVRGMEIVPDEPVA